MMETVNHRKNKISILLPNVQLFIRFIPSIIWMGCIFILSSQMRISVSDIYTINFFIFKTLHLAEFAFLTFLNFYAFYKGCEYSMTKALKSAFICSLAYAMFDEIHQTFVPTREGSLRDIGIDTIGIVISYLFIQSYFTSIKKYL